ncbi:DUF945 family protein [Marinospirillum sp.]|uniref:DUF945 family protein n=1 Tax=Marinospirillum sp. TaxID=2183934 RepID=UPI00384FFDEF
MKKLWVIGLGVILVAVVTLTLATGKTFTGQLDKLSAELAEDPRIRVVSSDKDSGWLSSSGEMTLAFTLDDQADLLVTSQWQASHRPGWVDYQGTTRLHVEEGEERLDLLDELGVEPLPFQGRADWSHASYLLELPALTMADPDFSIDFSGGQLEAGYEYESGRQTGQLQAAFLQLGGGEQDPSRLNLEDVLLSWDQQGTYPWISGDMKLNLARLHFNGPQGEVAFAEPQISQQMQMSEESFDLSLSLDTGEATSNGRSLGSAALSVRTDRFDGQASADLLEFFGQEADWESLDEEAMQPGLMAMNRLLEGSPALLLENFQVSLVTPVEMTQKAEGSVSFDGRNLPSRYLNRLSDGEIAEDDLMSRMRVELLFDKINPELLRLVGIPPFLQDESAEQQSVVWEGGELRMNGKLLPF